VLVDSEIVIARFTVVCCLENPEMSGNLTAVGEVPAGKKSCDGKLVMANLKSGITALLSKLASYFA